VVAAWNPVTGAVGFEVTPIPGAECINTLVATGEYLYGGTSSGTLFVVDPARGSVVDTSKIADHVGQLAVHEGTIYGVTGDSLIAVDPDSRGIETLLEGLDPHWFNWPMLSVDEAGRTYFLEGDDLVRATL